MVDSDTRIAVVTPAGSGAVAVTVTTPVVLVRLKEIAYVHADGDIAIETRQSRWHGHQQTVYRRW
jgi:hypothetical protein